MQTRKTGREGRYSDSGYDASYDETDPLNFAADLAPIGRPSRRSEFSSLGQSPVAQAAAASAQRPGSVIDANSEFEGRYQTEQDLRVEGKVGGEIVCGGFLTIEKDAIAKAKIQASDAEVRGRVEGEITCSGRLFVASSAVVVGTMSAAKLVVEEGATVSGKFEMAKTVARPAAAPRVAAVSSPEPEGGDDGAAGDVPGVPSRTRREAPTFALVSSDDRESDLN